MQEQSLDFNNAQLRNLNQGFIQVKAMEIRLNFTEPDMVSRSALDTMSITVKPQILSYDSRYKAQTIIMNGT